MNQLHKAVNRIASVALIIFTSLFSHSQSNYAVNFDATDKYISIPHNSAFNVTNSFTIEAWIKTSSATTRQVIAAKMYPGTDTWLFELQPNGGGVKLNLYTKTTTGNDHLSSSLIPAGTWYHVAATYDGSNIRFYVNGIADGVVSQTGSLQTNTEPLRIGAWGAAWGGGDERRFNGSIDEVRLWNTVRTQAAIKANMFNRNLSNSTSGLIAYYRMNEGSGTTAGNSSTNTTGIDGTLTNGPAWVASPIQFAANALKFNGSSNYVELTNRINIGSSDFTIEAWVYPQSTSVGMVFAQDVCGDAEQQFRFYTNNSKVNFDMSDAAALGVPYNFQLPSTANSVPLNTWTHIAVTRSGNSYTLYINGVSNATYSSGSNTINNQSGADVNKRLRIGARGGVSGGCGLNYFNGSIDEVRFWNVARTGIEIQQNYGKEIYPAANANLAAYYTFDQGIASGTNTGITAVIDQAGNNNGTLTGFSLSGATSNFVAQTNGMSVLPLRWISFTAQKQNEVVLLEWSTAGEINVSDFQIEHSVDGRNWKMIGSAVSDNTATINRYSYIDHSPVSGVNYYRIRQDDKNGKYSYSEIRSVRMDSEGRPFEVLSNPAVNKTMQLRINRTDDQVLSLFYSDGRLLWTKKLSPGMHFINVKGSNGIYLLKAGMYTQKLMIQ